LKAKNCAFISILVVGIVFFSCSANKDITETGLNVTTTGTSEGIHLHIGNIPSETNYLSLSMYNITVNNGLYTGTQFQDKELEQIKKTGFIICPFVINGNEYQIEITSYLLTEEDMIPISSVTTTAIANGGIHLINNPALTWNDNIITLSEKPVFSNDGINAQNVELKYGLVFIGTEATGSGMVSGGLGETTTELIFDSTEYFYSIVELIGNIGLSGDVPIFANVLLSLDYDETIWTLVFAKSENKIYSL